MTKIDKTTGLPIDEAWLFWISIGAMIVLFGLPLLNINVTLPSSVDGIVGWIANFIS